MSENQFPKNLINIITFNVTATNTVDEGIIPWVNIGKANEEILNLIDAEEIVLNVPEINIAIDYPLSQLITIKLTSSEGFSRKKLLIEIRKIFQDLSKTNAFDIYALDLVALDVYKTETGAIEVTMDIDI